MPNTIQNKEVTKRTLKQKITDFIEDTATLDVLTLTGNIDLVIKEGAPKEGESEFQWDAIFKKIAAQLKADEQTTAVSVLAYTHAEWDQDSVNFVAEEADASLVTAHNDAVKAAHEARLNAIKSVADAVDKLF